MNKGDFIKMDLNGWIDATGKIFETTDEETAKKENIYSNGIKYGPVLVVAGSGSLLPGLEDEVAGMKVGEEKEVVLLPEKAFGARRADLLKVVPVSELKKHEIPPIPGMPVMIDNIPGIIRSVGSGRAVIDFNHPRAGEKIKYKIKIVEKIEKDEDKIRELVNYKYKENACESVELKGEEALVHVKKDLFLEPQDKSGFTNAIFAHLPCKKVSFMETTEKKEEKENEKAKEGENKEEAKAVKEEK